jgi:hypothetical protein
VSRSTVWPNEFTTSWDVSGEFLTRLSDDRGITSAKTGVVNARHTKLTANMNTM